MGDGSIFPSASRRPSRGGSYPRQPIPILSVRFAHVRQRYLQRPEDEEASYSGRSPSCPLCLPLLNCRTHLGVWIRSDLRQTGSGLVGLHRIQFLPGHLHLCGLRLHEKDLPAAEGHRRSEWERVLIGDKLVLPEGQRSGNCGANVDCRSDANQSSIPGCGE